MQQFLPSYDIAHNASLQIKNIIQVFQYRTHLGKTKDNITTLAILTNQLYELEKLLAKYTYSSTQKRDAKLQNNVKNLTEILSYYPSFFSYK
jgi:hypothetical protein